MPEPLSFTCQPFDALSPLDVHDMLRARQDVFVVEQACLFHDIDGRDPACHHLLGRAKGNGAPESSAALAAYGRIVPPGVIYKEPSIGRVLTTPPYRRTGLGRRFMAEAVSRCKALHPGHAIRIGAQHRLEAFYTDLGFISVSAPYDEDGIAHVEMLLSA